MCIRDRPTSEGLRKLAPNKTMQTILSPMGKVQNTIAAHRMAIGKSSYMERSRGNQFLHNGIFSDTSKQQFQKKLESRAALQRGTDVSKTSAQSNPALLDSSFTWNQAYQLAPHDMSRLKRSFAPAGQSTQMIIGATGESDYTLLQKMCIRDSCNYLEPKEREMSMVFQNYALYPNMTVYGNIAYSLKIRKVPKKEIDQRVREVARILEIESLLDRKPAALSGGQKQRVAIGAAIIRQPKAFLMDEPLSNLDAKLRAQMRVELQKLHKQLDTTIIYVTHDQTEAMTLGTKIVVMKDGLIQQVDTPQNIYDHPVNKFVAGFVGAPTMNFIECEVEKEFDKTVLLFATTGPVKKVYPTGRNEEILRKEYLGKRVTLGIRPEDIYEYEEAKASGFAKNSAGIRAVSYTHLDVYKRQLRLKISSSLTRIFLVYG